MSLDKYINDNYYDLLQVANNIVRRKAINQDEEAHDLLSCALEYALTQREKFIGKDDKEIGLMIRSIMKNKHLWRDSDFNKEKEMISNKAKNIEELSTIADDSVVISLVIDSELVSNNFKQFIKDNMLNYSEEQVHKIISTKIAYHHLEKHERILFDKYFVKDYTMRQLASETTLPLCAIFKQITILKQKIKELCLLNYRS